ncbi:phenylalanine--tRNA ligase subunit beta [Tilletia horrida]|uniref:phenylalanine--tRNA ligase n=1 Tax=Tilletia horrida TaxID=155126 RepID=A0AAN6GL84_9BASI|nr:phenylalanine--tRNA ligase subunit beta [Tilletia horrida]KAK0551542.1 phenylalanine--tRNA ligase subunit beta [Tilletia horrida]KAK0569525.1 phenylalanine--tRNA ligase subunit beta [Tilletia horrida]
MPTVSVDQQRFLATLGPKYTVDEFDKLCFQFGIELDEIVPASNPGERDSLKIDIPANRYDLLCHEGISRALLVYLGKQPAPKYTLSTPAELLEIRLSEDVAKIRPFFAGAILRNVTFTPENYASFIDLQDKLHQNLGRRRTLVSMGTHDLDTIQAPFSYEALPPKDIKFAPLNKTEVYDGESMFKMYEQDRHISKYLGIIKDSPVYPVIYDAQRRVCSLPPIINSEHSKVTLNTKNLFIDMTATDQTKLNFALNILVAMFSVYCSEPFVIEPIRVVMPDGKAIITPDLSPRATTATTSYINRCTGLNLTAPQIAEYLQRMGHTASPAADNETINVEVPVTRPDILHECDLMEDVAVAYGFDNLPKRFPSTNTVAAPLPINKLSDILRKECAYAGWIEVLPLILCSHDENFAFLNRTDKGPHTAITLENPKSLEYQIVRTSLLPGILKTIRENKKHALPLRTFEVSDVAFKSDAPEDAERCAKNERRLGAVWCDKSAAFEVVHGLLDRLMRILAVKRLSKASGSTAASGPGYYIVEEDDPTFFPGRAASIYFRPAPSTAAPSTAAPTASLGALSNEETASVAAGAVTAQPPVTENTSSTSTTKAAAQVAKGALDTVKSQLGAALDSVLPASVSSSGAASKAWNPATDIYIGQLGVLHPTVLEKFEIGYPCSAMEFNVEPFL